MRKWLRVPVPPSVCCFTVWCHWCGIRAGTTIMAKKNLVSIDLSSMEWAPGGSAGQQSQHQSRLSSGPTKQSKHSLTPAVISRTSDVTATQSRVSTAGTRKLLYYAVGSPAGQTQASILRPELHQPKSASPSPVKRARLCPQAGISDKKCITRSYSILKGGTGDSSFLPLKRVGTPEMKHKASQTDLPTLSHVATDSSELPNILNLTIPAQLLSIAVNQNEYPNQTAIVGGTFNQSQGIEVSISIGTDNDIHLNFKALGGEPIVKKTVDGLNCKLSAIDDTYQLISGLTPSVTPETEGQPFMEGTDFVEGNDDGQCDESAAVEMMKTEITEESPDEEMNLNEEPNAHREVVKRVKRAPNRALGNYNSLEYVRGKKLDLSKTSRGNVICEICEAVNVIKMFKKLYMLRDHIFQHHGVLWSEYLKYVLSKGKPDGKTLKEALVKKSDNHQATKLIRTDYQTMSRACSDDTAEIECPICRKFTGLSEQVLAHLRLKHRCHANKAVYSKTLLEAIPEEKLVKFSTVLFTDSRQRSEVGDSGLYRCVLCSIVNFKQFSLVRIHAMKNHFITWFDYLRILHEDDEEVKMRRIQEVKDHEKQEAADLFEITGYNLIERERQPELIRNEDQPRTASEKTPAICPECNSSYSKAQRLMSHIRSKHKSYPDLQGLIHRADDAVYENEMQNHKKLRRDLILKCWYCERERAGALLFPHLKRCHSTEATFTGKLCAMKDEYIELLKANARGHKLGLYQCRYCEKTFPAGKRRSRHETILCKNNPNRYTIICEVCHLFKGRTQAALDLHMERIHKGGQKHHCCWVCHRYRSISRAEVDAHIARRHPGSELSGKFRCGICRVFRAGSQESVDKHVATQHSSEEKPPVYPCPHCDKVYNYTGSRSKHIRVAHRLKQGDKTITGTSVQCKDCNDVFKSDAALENHISSVHDAALGTMKPRVLYPCPHCDKVYNWSGSRSKHIRVAHRLKQGDKTITGTSVQCKDCNDVFESDAALENHISRVHDISLEVPTTTLETHISTVLPQHCLYRCGNCAQDFTTEQSLHKHSCGNVKPEMANTNKATSTAINSVLNLLDHSGSHEMQASDPETQVVNVLDKIHDELDEKSNGQQYVITTADGSTYEIVYVEPFSDGTSRPAEGNNVALEHREQADTSRTTGTIVTPEAETGFKQPGDLDLTNQQVVLPGGNIVQLEPYYT